ncbi:MAG: ABC transporter permease [Verrucomicrobia bacterium]|nr:ABC transporter permease [Verrucomicrobiota bacterium]
MIIYIVRRLVQMIPVLFGVTLLVFSIIRLKGDPVLQLVPDYYTMEQIEAVRREYGFDRPIYVQYVDFLQRALRGDFGRSFRNRQPAWTLVQESLPRTLQLGLTAMGFALLVSVPLGTLSALWRNSPLDWLVTTVSVGGRALPSFWLGILLILIFAVNLRWVPVSGTGGVAGELPFKYLILPALTLSTGLITTFTRLIRSSMLEVLGENYITTARAKGLPQALVIFRHALRNSLIPVVTVLGLNVGWLLGGAVIVEQVFAWPGMGRLMIQAIFARDNSIVQACLLVTAVTIMMSNLVVDVLYTVLDPRIRYS